MSISATSNPVRSFPRRFAMTRLTTTRVHLVSLCLLLLLALGLLSGCHSVAPTAMAPAPQPRNIIQRHPTASSLAAGYAAYKAAKVTGQNREAAGGHKNIMQRHPFLTGAAAAVAAHHMIKKSMQH